MAFNCPDNSNRSNFRYEFNWLVWLNDMLPIKRRTVSIFSWFAVPFKELQNMYLSFLLLRCELLFQSAANGQTIILERFLNMLFDDIDRGIIIENTLSNFETLYLYRRGEQPSVGDESFLYQKGEFPLGNQEYLFNKDEVELSVDFIVKVPSAIYGIINLGQLAAIVDKYKFVGTKYKIEQY